MRDLDYMMFTIFVVVIGMLLAIEVVVILAEVLRSDAFGWVIGRLKRQRETTDTALTLFADTNQCAENYPHHITGRKKVDFTLVLTQEQYDTLLKIIVEDLFFADNISKLTDMIARLEEANPL